MDTTISNIQESQMHSAVQDICRRAIVNAKRMGHAEVTPTHLMLGVLARGNDRTNGDPLMKAAAVLRDLGLEYESLKGFLEAALPSQTLAGDFEPSFNDSAHYTLRRALNYSKAHYRAKQSQGTIITGDLVKAMLDGHDVLLQQAFDTLAVDRMVAKIAFNDRMPLQEEQRTLHLVG